jgi:hypothetical protein
VCKRLTREEKKSLTVLKGLASLAGHDCRGSYRVEAARRRSRRSLAIRQQYHAATAAAIPPSLQLLFFRSGSAQALERRRIVILLERDADRIPASFSRRDRHARGSGTVTRRVGSCRLLGRRGQLARVCVPCDRHDDRRARSEDGEDDRGKKGDEELRQDNKDVVNSENKQTRAR